MHTVGVSLMLHGVTIPNNSLVDLDDLLYSTPGGGQVPSNGNEFYNQTVVCLTDLDDCCQSVRGYWYYPDSSTRRIDGSEGRGANFRSNRGPNAIINGQQFYGSVHLWRRYTPPERGRFRCELPSAADPNVNQILYVNIGES